LRISYRGLRVRKKKGKREGGEEEKATFDPTLIQAITPAWPSFWKKEKKGKGGGEKETDPEVGRRAIRKNSPFNILKKKKERREGVGLSSHITSEEKKGKGKRETQKNNNHKEGRKRKKGGEREKGEGEKERGEMEDLSVI